eukprot:TRINITY_DN3846_c0_g3_i2.p1 TRINITY_DN3846_c0_g3~~TRINITY_DN3846_c0_g3_i2.p1  ORF type:complete len:716 (-),score=106.89 TRINITY_DN3846_c0_g3_i2:113-2260(-)
MQALFAAIEEFEEDLHQLQEANANCLVETPDSDSPSGFQNGTTAVAGAPGIAGQAYRASPSKLGLPNQVHDHSRDTSCDLHEAADSPKHSSVPAGGDNAPTRRLLPRPAGPAELGSVLSVEHSSSERRRVSSKGRVSKNSSARPSQVVPCTGWMGRASVSGRLIPFPLGNDLRRGTQKLHQAPDIPIWTDASVEMHQPPRRLSKGMQLAAAGRQMRTQAKAESEISIKCIRSDETERSTEQKGSKWFHRLSKQKKLSMNSAGATGIPASGLLATGSASQDAWFTELDMTEESAGTTTPVTAAEATSPAARKAVARAGTPVTESQEEAISPTAAVPAPPDQLAPEDAKGEDAWGPSLQRGGRESIPPSTSFQLWYDVPLLEEDEAEGGENLLANSRSVSPNRRHTQTPCYERFPHISISHMSPDAQKKLVPGKTTGDIRRAVPHLAGKNDVERPASTGPLFQRSRLEAVLVNRDMRAFLLRPESVQDWRPCRPDSVYSVYRDAVEDEKEEGDGSDDEVPPPPRYVQPDRCTSAVGFCAETVAAEAVPRAPLLEAGGAASAMAFGSRVADLRAPVCESRCESRFCDMPKQNGSSRRDGVHSSMSIWSMPSVPPRSAPDHDFRAQPTATPLPQALVRPKPVGAKPLHSSLLEESSVERTGASAKASRHSKGLSDRSWRAKLVTVEDVPCLSVRRRRAKFNMSQIVPTAETRCVVRFAQ